MRKLSAIFIVLLFSVAFAYSQPSKRVVARYTYYAPLDMSVEVAQQKALEQAQIEAIAVEFGVKVSQNNFHSVEEGGDTSTENFKSIGSSEIFGEWIETIGVPVFDTRVEKQHIVVNVEAEGYIREISEARADLEITLLRNGIEKQFVTEDFHSGDDMYLMFKAPEDGYVLIYLVDAFSNVYCLLPYLSSGENNYKVLRNKEYVFFSQSFSNDFLGGEIVDEYTMTADKPVDYNSITVVYSPNKIIKASDTTKDELTPRSLSFNDFQEWLASNRKRDKLMQVQKLDFIIKR